ncbi:MAG: 2-isopropylmalate synthase [Akkermansia sp.]
MKQTDKVLFFDTTLRDGEQCPGASMNLRQKLEVARQLEKLGIDVIEAGFPCISDGDFEAVHTIATTVKNCKIAGLARCVENDIRKTAEAVAPAGDRGRIHTFLATSPLHREFKLKKSKEQIIEMAVEGVKLAASLVADVEFSAEDASRTELDYLAQVVEAVIDAGATTINLPDTVGFTTPDEYYTMVDYIMKNVPNMDKAIISVHCHNDIGLAVANSLAAVRAGARQVEGTINGIGERAGNVALEEVAMALYTRPEALGFEKGEKPFNMVTEEIVKTSRVVSRMSGLSVQRSKAIVGENAFAHSSGIHQHGILAKRETYEVIDPVIVGWGETELPLTKHSGRAAVKARLEKLGHSLSAEEVAQVFERFKKIGDSKKFVYDDDLASLVNESLDTNDGKWQMKSIQFVSSTDEMATATISLLKDGKIYRDCSIGNGPVDACLKAIDRITKTRGRLVEYGVHATSAGKDALGDVSLKIQFGDGEGKPILGKGAATDVIEASARAYLNAVNRMISLAELN